MPTKAGIQHSEAFGKSRDGVAYWIIRLRG
jgi:hypothetical protein